MNKLYYQNVVTLQRELGSGISYHIGTIVEKCTVEGLERLSEQQAWSDKVLKSTWTWTRSSSLRLQKHGSSFFREVDVLQWGGNKPGEVILGTRDIDINGGTCGC